MQMVHVGTDMTGKAMFMPRSYAFLQVTVDLFFRGDYLCSMEPLGLVEPHQGLGMRCFGGPWLWEVATRSERGGWLCFSLKTLWLGVFV